MAYGALFGAVLGVLITKGRETSVDLLDRLAPSLGLAIAFGRLGCFFAGCDHGLVTADSFAVRYPRGTATFVNHHARGLVGAEALTSLPVLPVTLLEALGGFLVFLLASHWLARTRTRGSVIVRAAASYAVLRFLLEFLRDDPRAMIGVLSLPQVLSLGVLLVALYLHRPEAPSATMAR